MKQTLIDLFTSKKFIAAVTAIIVYVAGRIGFDVDTATLDHIWQALLVYVGAQGLADLGKSAAQVSAAADSMPIGQLPAPAPSSAAKAGTVATVALLAAVIGGISLVPACSTVSSDVKAFANGAVTCAKADAVQAKALGLQLGVDALAGFLAGQDAITVWNKVAADAEAGAKTQGVAVGACAFDGVIADVEKILHPTTPGTATSALTATGAATAVDPLAAGRAALAAFESAHGVTSVMQ
jgi:hypothetical protein